MSKTKITTDPVDFDLMVYCGPINRVGYDQISDQCNAASSKKCLLILTTLGGDPHAAFRIARALRHHFTEKLTVFVPHYCKSAGTLISIAANELVIDDRGELGPLDVQVKKSDEIFEQSSGLDVPEALNFLHSNVQNAVQNFLMTLKMQMGLGTKMSASMAAEMVSNLYSAIFAQIDPLKIGELQRAIRIAFEYGDRLNSYTQNLKNNALGRLVSAYPSHGFVIDRKEAGQLFERVRAPNPTEKHLWSIIRPHMSNPQAQNVQLIPRDQVIKVVEAASEASKIGEDRAGNDDGLQGNSPGQGGGEPSEGNAAGANSVDGNRESRNGRAKTKRRAGRSDEQPNAG